ncbi:MAG TPA: hypothetical protein VK919_08600, partial [Solirubrobacterales bacterium]|nr:hypothetical protein [Solirubrobacterales bacterium]
LAAVGGGAWDPGARALAAPVVVARRPAEAGIAVVCGGLGGVMEAAARGAAGAGGDVIGIIPGDDPAAANPHCTHVVATGVGYARNLAVVASGDAVVAIGGEWGTLSEIAFARRIGRPVIALDSWTVKGVGPMAQAPGIEVVADPAGAVAAVERALATGSSPAARGG